MRSPSVVSAPRGGTDVLLGDPPLRPGAAHPGEVDAELGSHFAHEGCRADFLFGSGSRLRRALLRLGRRPVASDHDEDGADRHDLALGNEDPRDGSARRGRDLDRRLVGRDLDERRVLGDLLALLDEPAGDLALGQALAEVGQLELVGHTAVLADRQF